MIHVIPAGRSFIPGCQLGQRCMKLPAFTGMAFNQSLLAPCPWLSAGGATPICPPIRPSPPSLPDLHKYNRLRPGLGTLPPVFLIDDAEP